MAPPVEANMSVTRTPPAVIATTASPIGEDENDCMMQQHVCSL